MIDAGALNGKINIREEAERAGAIFHRNGRTWQSHCIIHGGDNNTALTLFDDGSWQCFTHGDECNRWGHDGIGFLRALNNWTFQQVAENVGQPDDPQEAQRRATERAELAAKDLQRQIEEAQKALEELQQARRWVQYHEALTEPTRELWRARGIPDGWQDFWKFGYSTACPTYRQSSSLTIPIYTPGQKDPVQIRHRLLNPSTPNDKYRPEISGMTALPFYSDPELSIANAERVIVVEGEIKAAVTLLTVDRPLWQVIGLPGKDYWRRAVDLLEGRGDAVIIFDPDAKGEAVKLARAIGGARVVDLPGKLDDMIIENGLDQYWVESICHNARSVK